MDIRNNNLIRKINRNHPTSMPMRVRLFFFLILMVFTMLSGIIVILILTGTFTAGYKENQELIRNELLHTSEEISKQFGQISLQTVKFSEALSESIKANLSNLKLSSKDITNHPDIIESIILDEFELTFFTLQKSYCSGAFFILDATVNPQLDDAMYSKAGIYIKNMEPNIISSSDPTVTILRGFPSLGRKNLLDLDTQWNLEFDIEDADYWSFPMTNALNNPTDDLSKQYYWSKPLTLPGTSEEVILCSAPLKDSDNNIFGICGLEISAMLFKLSYMPKHSSYSRMFTMISPVHNNTIDISKSMIAGGYSIKSIFNNEFSFQILDNNDALSSYIHEDGTTYVGYHTYLKLYPSNSHYSDDSWISAVMLPKEDFVNSILRLNLLLILLLTLLVFVGIIISVIFSNRYTKPISKGIEIIKSTQLEKVPKTNIQEINDLIDYFSLYKKEIKRKLEQEKMQISALEEFAEKTKILTPAERSVFNLYAQGMSANDIANQLYLSINTIKTHTKHIFSKLNIATRKELLLYINLLKEIGKELK